MFISVKLLSLQKNGILCVYMYISAHGYEYVMDNFPFSQTLVHMYACIHLSLLLILHYYNCNYLLITLLSF